MNARRDRIRSLHSCLLAATVTAAAPARPNTADRPSGPAVRTRCVSRRSRTSVSDRAQAAIDRMLAVKGKRTIDEYAARVRRRAARDQLGFSGSAA